MKLNELRARRRELQERARAIVDADQVTDEGLAEINQIRAEVDELDRRIDAAAMVGVIEERGEQRPAAGPPIGDTEGDHPWESEQRAVPARGAGREFRSLFPDCKPAADGFRDAEEFYGAVHRLYTQGIGDARLQRAMTAGAGADGGFLVPAQFVAQMLDASLESEIVRPRAQTYGMTSDTMSVPGWDGATHTSTLYGGLTAYWVGEAQTIDASQAKLRMVGLTARKLAILTQVSNELLQDGVGFEAQMGTALTRTLGWTLDYACIWGTGAGQPLGAMNAASTVTVAKEGGQANDTIVYDNITKMFAQLHPTCYGNAIWLASPTVIPQLLKLSIPVGTGGTVIPVLQGGGQSFSMLGRPVVFSEKCTKLGDLGDILLVDWCKYAMGIRSDLSLDSSPHLGFASATTYLRGLLRCDGQPLWNQAITPKNGDAQTWCVTLAAR